MRFLRCIWICVWWVMQGFLLLILPLALIPLMLIVGSLELWEKAK